MNWSNRDGNLSLRMVCSAGLCLLVLVLFVSTPLYAGSSTAVSKELSSIEGKLEKAVENVKQKRRKKASSLVFEAFMEFEESNLHGQLAAKNQSLYTKLESAYMGMREAIQSGESLSVIESRFHQVQELHSKVRDQLNIKNASVWTMAVSSFMIIFREGLEAILVLAAMLAYLAKIEAEKQKSSIYWGTGVAILASLLLAVGANTLFSISGAQRELLEGVTMLLATGVLFYVSFWLISKIEAQKWKQFIQSKIDQSIEAGSSFMLGAVAFLVVFREGFETVLFYQALAFSTSSGLMGGGVVGGFIVGTVLMLLICYIVIKSSAKIPIKPFFVATSVFLYLFAFKFAGDGIVELQEAGVLPSTTAGFVPDITWLKTLLGIYPKWQPLMAQSLLISAVLFGLLYTFRRQLPLPSARSA
ncbi:MAG: FTR1 family protein [bacterium]